MKHFAYGAGCLLIAMIGFAMTLFVPAPLHYSIGMLAGVAMVMWCEAVS